MLLLFVGDSTAAQLFLAFAMLLEAQLGRNSIPTATMYRVSASACGDRVRLSFVRNDAILWSSKGLGTPSKSGFSSVGAGSTTAADTSSSAGGSGNEDDPLPAAGASEDQDSDAGAEAARGSSRRLARTSRSRHKRLLKVTSKNESGEASSPEASPAHLSVGALMDARRAALSNRSTSFSRCMPNAILNGFIGHAHRAHKVISHASHCCYPQRALLLPHASHSAPLLCALKDCAL